MIAPLAHGRLRLLLRGTVDFVYCLSAKANTKPNRSYRRNAPRCSRSASQLTQAARPRASRPPYNIVHKLKDKVTWRGIYLNLENALYAV